tara:strand:- start:2443 stop:2823 length:381 start_codon:yes stop_codon:yes gene_type:complete
MTKLVIDAAKNDIFFMIISDSNIYSITHENSKMNYDKLITLVIDFLNNYNFKMNDINLMYINRGPGSFAGIRNTLSMIKAIHMIKKIDYYCFSFKDFKGEKDLSYENIPNLCEKFKIEKNLINPIY